MTVYLDNASTTKIDQMVFAEMLPYLKENYANASSLHSLGRKSRQAIEHAREQVAKSINAEPSQIFFTSGATESNNWVCSNFSHFFDIIDLTRFIVYIHMSYKVRTVLIYLMCK